MQHQRLARVAEEAAVPGIEIALRRQPLGKQDRVCSKLDVEIIDRSAALLLTNGGAVDQLAGADQLAAHEDGMIGRDQQIGVRGVVGECVGFDADRRQGFRSRMCSEIYAPMADPLDRLRLQLTV